MRRDESWLSTSTGRWPKWGFGAVGCFLAEQGIPTTRATLYNLVYKEAIPYKKFGRRTVFSKRELLAWIESRTVCRNPKDSVEKLRIKKEE